MDEASGSAPRKLFIELASNTSLHGLPNMYRATTLVRKTVWGVLFVLGLGLCIYQVTHNFLQYYSYPTSTSVGRAGSDSLEFPAVTFCNNNPMRLSYLNSSQMGRQFYTDLPMYKVYQLSADGWLEFGTNEIGSVAFYQLYSTMNSSTRAAAGHQMQHMILSCTFNGITCEAAHFHHVLNGRYGNCYTFYLEPTISWRLTSNTGPVYGLHLELLVEASEYIPLVTDVAGFRVVIHNRTYMPLPEKQGFSIEPGHITFVGLERIEETRAEAPWGVCEYVDGQRNAELNAYVSEYPYVTYTEQACEYTCYQRHVMETCGCGDVEYPLSGDAYPFLQGETARACSNDTESTCNADVFWAMAEGLLDCSAVCPQMCFQVTYDREISYGTWPSPASSELLYQRIASIRSLTDSLQDSTKEEWVKVNAAKLVVYFRHLKYDVVVTSGSYTVINLLSDQGGQVGLWLGLSVLTLFEIAEFMTDLIHMLGLMCCHSVKSKPKQVHVI